MPIRHEQHADGRAESYWARTQKLIEQCRGVIQRLAGEGTSPPSAPEYFPGLVDNVDAAEDPMGSLWHHVSHAGQLAARGQLVMGVFRHPDYGMVFHCSPPNSNTLTIGPPQVNKTSWMAAMIAGHLGPAVIFTTKDDLVDFDAVLCARKGDVFQLDLTGRPARPGMIEGRISLIAGGATWTAAKRIGSTLAKAAAPADSHNHKFWEQNAAGYLAVPVFAACLAGKDKTTEGYQFLLDCVSGDRGAVEEMADILADLGGDDGQVALRKWASYENMHPEGLGSIRLTAGHVVQVMERREVRERSVNPNIDLRALVASSMPLIVNPDVAENETVRALAHAGVVANDGWPTVARAPTVFVTVDEGDDEAAVLARALVHQLWAAVKDQHAADRRDGITGRPKLLLAWDELATGFADPAYPKMAAQCADQGLIIAAAIHDLGQVEEVWGKAVAETFLTIHRQINVFPGVSHVATLNALSTLIGNKWDSRRGESSGSSIGGTGGNNVTRGETWTEQRLPILEPGEIRAGKPGDRTAVLSISTDAWGWVWPTPIWGAPPWPRAIVASMRFVVDATVAFDGQTYFLGALPVPELDRRDNSGAVTLARTQRDGSQLLDEYLQLRRRFLAVREAHPNPEPYRLIDPSEGTE